MVLLVITYTVLLFVVVLTIINWKSLGFADKIIGFYILLGALEEIIALVAVKYTGSSYFTAHVYTPIEFFILCLYFNQTISFFKKRNSGVYLGIVGIILSIINSLFFQDPFKSSNSYFLVFEASTVVIMCLLSFFQILMDEERMPYSFAHFWITVSLFLFWSSTFTGWSLFNLFSAESEIVAIFGPLLRFSALFLYGILSLVLMRYRKLIPSGA